MSSAHPDPTGTDLVLPSVDELLESAMVVALPMRRRFRGITVREAMIFRGPAGWGEFAPFVEYDDSESAWWLAAGIEAAYLGPPPPPLRDRVAINATVPAVPAVDVPDVLAGFPGAQAAKVKVAEPGCSLEEEVARVEAVRALIPTVRVDANARWGVEEAVTAIRAFGELEYVEQPCASVEELAAVRAAVDTPIAADESIRRAADPMRVVRAGAADVAILKVAPLGGMRRVLALAREIPMDVVVSSALDTAVGISAGLATAAALPGQPRACGLGTGSLFVTDVAPPNPPIAGELPVARVEPTTAMASVASPDRVQWWTRRLRRCHELLSSGRHPATGSPGGGLSG
ncbi:o-succinylbenzoate synthase [Gordonia jinhuaensis]|nr:o-succinylbenzoate synthase [Gordonia jinhuaensis]